MLDAETVHCDYNSPAKKERYRRLHHHWLHANLTRLNFIIGRDKIPASARGKRNEIAVL